MKRLISAGAGGLMLAAASLLLAPAHATAEHSARAGHCDGASCNGHFPQEGGCDRGAGTIATNHVQGHLVELRSSTTCHAVWVKIHGPVGTTGKVFNTANPPNQAEAQIDRGSDAHSAMINHVGVRASACITVPGLWTACTSLT